MTLAHVLLYLFASWGAAWALSMSHTGLALRKLLARVPVISVLINCSACLAFWIGLALANTEIVPMLSPAAPVVSKLAAAFAAAGFTRLVMPAEAPDA